MSNILTQNWLLEPPPLPARPRRDHRAAAAGLHDAAAGARAAAAAAQAAAQRVRLHPNGVNVLTWQITKAGRDYEFSAPLKPLEKHRDEHHADQRPASSQRHRPGARVRQDLAHRREDQPGGRRLPQHGLVPTSSWPRSPRRRRASPRWNFRSVARQRRTLGLVARRRAAAGRGQSARPSSTASSASNRAASTSSAAGSTAAAACSTSCSTTPSRCAANLGSDDRTKLDEYLHSVRDVESPHRAARLPGSNVPKPKVDTPTSPRISRATSRKTEAGDYYRTMYDLIVLALRTDMTRVVTYMSGSEAQRPGDPRDRHPADAPRAVAPQRRPRADGPPEPQRRLPHRAVRAISSTSCKPIKDGDEPLLDRTMVLFGSGMSYGHSHGNANLPTILAGGKALGLKHGQHIDYNLPKIRQVRPRQRRRALRASAAGRSTATPA